MARQIAQTSETDGQPVTVVNDLSREELAEAIAAQNGQQLGCLPVVVWNS